MFNHIKDLLKEDKNVLVIMRGVPGSGKSTAARELHTKLNNANLADGLPGYEPSHCDKDAIYPSVKICSTDDVNERLNGGEYIFEPGLLGLYHGINLDTAASCMRNKVNLVIIDNTNIKRKDFKLYVRAADHYGYEVVEYKVGETDFEGKLDILQCYLDRNTHNVPMEVIERMGRQFQE